MKYRIVETWLGRFKVCKSRLNRQIVRYPDHLQITEHCGTPTEPDTDLGAGPGGFVPVSFGPHTAIGILRGAGNAIVPQVAAAFIKAAIDGHPAFAGGA